jgi:hypothetical protein
MPARILHSVYGNNIAQAGKKKVLDLKKKINDKLGF